MPPRRAARAAAAALLAAAAVAAAGCAATPPAPRPPSGAHVAPSTSPGSFAALAARFTDRALAQARAGDLRRSIDSWRAVAALRPGAAEPKKQIEELTARLAAEAGRQGAGPGAPAAPAASAASAAPAAPTAPAGPATPPPPAAPPAPAGPPAPPEAALSPQEAEERLANAERLLAAGDFETAATAAERLAGHATAGARARELAADAWLAAGENALKQDRLAAALAALRKAAPLRPGAEALAATAEQLARERAEEHYTAGVRHFVDQDLDAAIRSWERALSLNPAHAGAARDIENARELQRKLQQIR